MMTPLFAHFGAASSPAVELGVSWQAFVVQLLTFLIIFLILRQWAFKPILKVLRERRELIEGGVALGEKMRAEEAKLEEEVAKKLHSARQQADALLADAETEVREKFQAGEESAQKRAEVILKEAAEQIKQATERERTKLEKEIVGLVSEVSEAIIHEKVDATKDAQLIDKALREHRTA